VITAGKLRHRIEIQRATDTQGATFGNAKRTYTTFARVWAAVEPASGSEKFISDQMQAGVTHVVTIRHLAGVTSKMQVIHKERTLQVVSVVNVEERDRKMLLMCEEKV
jgi:SPP1 family predicted phage head-tail adaptor